MAIKNPENILLNSAAVGKRWGCSEFTALGHLAKGKVPVIYLSPKMVRVRLSDLIAFEQSCTRPALEVEVANA